MRARHALLLSVMAVAALAATTRSHAGAFIFAEQGDENSIAHPNGYTGVGGRRVLSVCLRAGSVPTGVNPTQVENTIKKAVDTWNAQRVGTDNLALGADNDIPSGAMDFESVLLHEMGHCVGLAHPNHATESGLTGNATNGTKSTQGGDAAFNQGAGADGVHGSADDVRGDDGNLYWYASGSNDPLAYPAIIDTTTFRRTLGGLPNGQLYARNGDRSVLLALGHANTESVMQQGQGSDEAQRRLTGEDMAAIRFAAAGLDGLQGTADDYTLALDYIGRSDTCNITVEFSTSASFAYCQVGGNSINSEHVRITTAALNFSPTTNWFFSQAANTSTTLSMASSAATATGTPYRVTTSVAVNTSAPAGPPSGRVEVRDDLGNTCIATLAAGSGSCDMPAPTAGVRTLRAAYLGYRGFDASTSVTANHTVGITNAVVTLTKPDAATIVGQPYSVSATVTGSSTGGTPTGTVTIDDGKGANCNLTLAAGSGSCQLTSTVAGTLTLTGVYGGNATYSTNEDRKPHTVAKAATTMSIIARTPSTSVVGQPYRVYVSVRAAAPASGAAAGSVTIDDGEGQTCSVTLNAGAGNCALVSSTTGNRALSATFLANANYLTSSASATQPVTPATTTLALLPATPDTSASGQPFPVVFMLDTVAPGSGAASGVVTITASGGSETCTATLPQTSCQLTLARVGQHVLTAMYAGDGRYTASSDTRPHAVDAAASVTSITGTSPQPSRIGQAVTVRFSVAAQSSTAGTPGGSVTVSASGGGESCSATLPATSCDLVLQSAGTRTLTARYAGDGEFAASSGSAEHRVLGVETRTTVGTAQSPSAPGQAYTVSASVAALAGGGTPVGSVTIADDTGARCSGDLVDGAMQCALTASRAGQRVLTANYAGGGAFDASSASATHTVLGATALAIVSATPEPTPLGTPAQVTITITGDAALAAPTGTVRISTDREDASCVVTLPQTQCSLVLGVDGEHRLQAQYSGDATHAAASATRVHLAGDTPQIFADTFETD